MGGPSIDCHSNYSPNIDQSQDLSSKTGVTDSQLSAVFGKLSEIMREGLGSSGASREIADLRKENKAMRETSTEMLTGKFQSYDDTVNGKEGNSDSHRGGSLSFAFARQDVRSTDEADGKPSGGKATGLDAKPDSIDAKQNDRLAALEKQLGGDKTESVEDRQNRRLAALEGKLGGAAAGSAATNQSGLSAVENKISSDKRPSIDELQNERLTALENKLSGKSTPLYEYAKDSRIKYLESKLAERDGPANAGTAPASTERTDVKTGLPTKGTNEAETRLASDSGYDKKQNKELDALEKSLKNAGVDVPKASSYAQGDVGQDQRIKDLSKALTAYSHSVSTAPTKHDVDQDKQIKDMQQKFSASPAGFNEFVKIFANAFGPEIAGR